MLDIKRLQYLEAVYRYHNFTRASEELFVSQSAISMAIKSLEADLGVRLIVRSPQSVAFTYEGEQLVQHARRILLECENAEREMADPPRARAIPCTSACRRRLPSGFSTFSTRRNSIAPIRRPRSTSRRAP